MRNCTVELLPGLVRQCDIRLKHEFACIICQFVDIGRCQVLSLDGR